MLLKTEKIKWQLKHKKCSFSVTIKFLSYTKVIDSFSQIQRQIFTIFIMDIIFTFPYLLEILGHLKESHPSGF